MWYKILSHRLKNKFIICLSLYTFNSSSSDVIALSLGVSSDAVILGFIQDGVAWSKIMVKINRSINTL